MYFDAGLKVDNYIYLIEHFSRCLISIHIPSGNTRIKAYLPWKYIKNNIGMLLSSEHIIIYSPSVDYFFVYDYLNDQITSIKLQEMEADEAGYYFSNVLTVQDEFIILPFKSKKIKKYGWDGKLKFKDSQWCSFISRECGCNEKLFRNIRMESACVVGNQVFFSLNFGNKNYLCRYQLDKKEHLCNIVYNSDDIAIRGVYSYPNIVLFRRIFLDKTEILLFALDSNVQKKIVVGYSSLFEEDVYGEIQHLRASFRNEILKIEENDLKRYPKIYSFEQSDVYIENGILFNVLKNEIIILDADITKRYLIEKTVNEIKKSKAYQEGYRKLFDDNFIMEDKYKLDNLIKYATEYSSLMVEKIRTMKNNGKQIWNTVQ